MASALTIDISATRAITATGRLVAGETAAIAVTGGTPSALYLVDEKRAVVAVCDTFEVGAGTINLATVPIGRIFATVPAGRAVSLACLVEGEDDKIIGYGFVPVVSAPMPDDLVDVDVDAYIRASDIRALFQDIPTEYANQRSLSEALSQVVTVLKTLGLSVALALSAMATEWQDVPANTIIGDGLTLTNGTISAAGGGGGITTNDVRAIVANKADVIHGGGPASVSSNYITNNVFGNVVGDSVWVRTWDDLQKWYGSETLPEMLAANIAAATNGMATAEEVAQLRTDASLVYQLLMGSNVVAEVTNYNSRVHAPSFRLLQLDPDTHEYFTVWAETNGLARTLAAANEYTDAAAAELASRKADRGWGKYTSGLGAEAPSNTTWVSSPVTVLAGGYEYAKTVTSAGEAWVLCSNGMQTGPDTNAYFRVATMDGESLFSVERTESVLIGVDATGIRCSGNTVTIPLDVVSAEAPVCYATDDLTGSTWSDLTSGTLPAWITAAEATGSAGAWTWTITTTSPCGFFQFRALQEGRTVIRNNASVELSQGIWVNGKKYMPVVSGSTLTWTEAQ